MASRSGVEAGKAYVTLFADDSLLRRSLKRAMGGVKSLAAGVAKAGLGLAAGAAAISAPLLLAVKKFADAGDELDKMSLRTGVSAQALSELGFAAEQSGADLGAVEKGLRGMARTLLNADQGLSSSVDALAELGMTAADLQGLKPDEQFDRLASAVSDVEDPTRRAALSMRLFGRAGSELLPLFANGSDGIKALREEAQELGFVLSEEDAKSAAEATDAMNRLKRAIGGLFNRIGAAVAPAVTKIANILAHLTATISKSLKTTFASLLEAIGPTLQAIVNALSSGEYGKAAEVLWLRLKVAWLEGTGQLTSIWHALTGEISKGMLRFTSGMSEMWENMVHGLKQVWTRFAEFAEEIWLDTQSRLGFEVDQDRLGELINRNANRDRIEREEREDLAEKQQGRREKLNDAIQAVDDQTEAALDGVAGEAQKTRERLKSLIVNLVGVDVFPEQAADGDADIFDSFSQAVSGSFDRGPSGTFSSLASRQLGLPSQNEAVKLLQGIEENTGKAAKKDPVPAVGA